MRSRGTILFLAAVFFMYGCQENYITFQSQEITPENNKSSADTVMRDSLGDFYFSRLTKPGAAGLTATCWIGPAHQNKKMWVVFSGRMRTNYAHSNASITLAGTNRKNEVMIWRAVFLKYYAEEVNKWCYFKDSIRLPADYSGEPYGAVNVFAYLGNSERENFDMDTLRVQFKEEM